MKEEYKILFCDNKVVISFLILILSMFYFDSNRSIFILLVPVIVAMFLQYFLFIHIDNYELRDIDKWSDFLVQEQYKFCLNSIIKWNEILLKVIIFFISSIFTITYFLMEKPLKIDMVNIINFFRVNENRDLVFLIMIYFFATFMSIFIYKLSLRNRIKRIEEKLKVVI